MRKGLLVTACVAMLLMATAAFVQESSSPSDDDPRLLCEQALDRLMLGEAEGIDLLLEKLRANGQAEPPDVNWQMFRAQLGLLMDRTSSCGEPLGYELLETKQFGTTFVRYKYVVKYERKYVIWTFLLVRLNGPWSLHQVNFNTDLEALFE
ncbi:MAG TPA: hypothetical protein VMY37_18515 [Thermoguttaceae bacterium]|nr:hypothetical protein [Thermoguttaceae bacterium]